MQVLERILNKIRVLFLWMLWVHDVQEAGSQCLAQNYSHLFLLRTKYWVTSQTDYPRSHKLWQIFAQSDPIQRLTKLPYTRPSYVGRVLHIDQMLSRYAQAQHADRKQETVPSRKWQRQLTTIETSTCVWVFSGYFVFCISLPQINIPSFPNKYCDPKPKMMNPNWLLVKK